MHALCVTTNKTNQQNSARARVETTYRKRLKWWPEIVNQIAKHGSCSLQHRGLFILYHRRRRAGSRRGHSAAWRGRLWVMTPQHELSVLLRLDQLVLERRPTS